MENRNFEYQFRDIDSGVYLMRTSPQSKWVHITEAEFNANATSENTVAWQPAVPPNPEPMSSKLPTSDNKYYEKNPDQLLGDSVAMVRDRAKPVPYRIREDKPDIVQQQTELFEGWEKRGKPKMRVYTGKQRAPLGEVNLMYESERKYGVAKISSSTDAVELLRRYWDTNTIELQESFWAMYLNRANNVIAIHEAFKGGVSATVTDIKLLGAAAFKLRASNMIIAHNHPSGQTKPSQADRDLTKELGNVLKFHDVDLLDHIILTKDDYYSFADEGDLPSFQVPELKAADSAFVKDVHLKWLEASFGEYALAMEAAFNDKYEITLDELEEREEEIEDWYDFVEDYQNQELTPEQAADDIASIYGIKPKAQVQDPSHKAWIDAPFGEYDSAMSAAFEQKYGMSLHELEEQEEELDDYQDLIEDYQNSEMSPEEAADDIASTYGIEAKAQVQDSGHEVWISLTYKDPEGIDWAKDRLLEDEIEETLKAAGIKCRKGECQTGSGIDVPEGTRDITFHVPVEQQDKAMAAIEARLDELNIPRKEVNIRTGKASKVEDPGCGCPHVEDSGVVHDSDCPHYVKDSSHEVWAYHVTLREFLSDIQKEGLLPQYSPSAEEKVIFVEPDQEEAEIYAEKDSITLRFKTTGFAYTKDGESVVYNEIPPSELQIEEKGEWIPLLNLQEKVEDSAATAEPPETKKPEPAATPPDDVAKPDIGANYPNPFAQNKAIEQLIDYKEAAAEEYDPDEVEFIKRYAGYGGLEKYGAKGKGLLYEFYTPDKIIKALWALAYDNGFKAGGSILEPAVGTGEILRYAPENSKVTAFEISDYSYKIAKIIYPQHNIRQQYFEELFFKGNVALKGNLKGLPKFDLVIGNPPYGAFAGRWAGMGEKAYTKAGNYIEYFIFRGLDLLKKNGLLVYVIGTAVGTPWLDQRMSKIKEAIAEKGDLVRAVRLPNDPPIFTNTDVLPDIVVFKKN